MAKKKKKDNGLNAFLGLKDYSKEELIKMNNQGAVEHAHEFAPKKSTTRQTIAPVRRTTININQTPASRILSGDNPFTMENIQKNQKERQKKYLQEQNNKNQSGVTAKQVGNFFLNMFSYDPTYGTAVNMLRRATDKAKTGEKLAPSDVIFGGNVLSSTADRIRKTNEEKLNKTKDTETTIALKQKQKDLNKQLIIARNTKNKNYDNILKKYNQITDKLQTEQAKLMKKEKGVIGALEKGVNTFTGGLDSSVKGMDSTVDKLLGRKPQQRLGATEVLSNKALQETKGKVGKIALETSHSIGAMIPTIIGSLASGGVSTAISFGTYGGSAYNQAKRDGYTEEQATKYGAVNGGLEAMLNKILPSFKFGGKNVYGKVATDKLTKKIMTKTIGNEAFKRVITDATGEFTEEYLQEFLDPIVREALLEEDNGVGIIKGKKADEIAGNIASYTSKNFFSKENFRAGMMGAMTSGIMGTPSAIRSNAYTKATGRSAETGLTVNEQTVIDNIVENKKAELKEQNGKVSKKDIARIEKETRQDLERGYLDVNDIERALSTDEWNKHNEAVKQKESLQEKVDELKSKKMSDMTVDEYNSTNDQIKSLQEQIDSIDTDTTRSELNNAMDGKITNNDTLLNNTYNQEAEKNNAYQFDENEDVTETTKKINEDIKTLKLNNNIKTRDTIDLLKKISNDTGRQYRLVDNNSEQMQKEYNRIVDKIAKQDNISIEDAKKKTENLLIDGFVSNGEIFINVDSENLINRITGHETTHLFEGTEEYSALQSIARKFAETKGEYETRKQALQERYRGVEDADIENELTSDLVGDYLFSDINFVRNLSTEQPNIFKKIYNHVKHLYNMATAGSKEARQLEQLKYNFEKVYRENNQSKASTNTKLSIGGEKAINSLPDSKYKQDGLKSLEKAKQMLNDGKTNEEIRKETKWYQDKNNDWKFEFDDSNLTIKKTLRKNEQYKLSDIIDHDILFYLYPELKNYKVEFGNMKANGSFYKTTAKIKINNKFINNSDYLNLKGTMLHEIQHAIQHIEGFENGTNSKLSKKAYYQKLGEIEADDTKNRYMRAFNKNIRQEIAPETSKANPKHSQYDAYMKNRKAFDKVKDTAYNLIKRGVSDNEQSQEIVSKNQREDNALVDGGRLLNKELDSSFSSTTKYSISEKTGKLQDSKGNNVKLETSETGTTGSLMAIHNLSEDKMKGILELGGFPVPSIAITNPDIVNHQQFGDISVLFDKSTIDPAIADNEVYDRDVWSPTFPQIDYELNEKGIEKVAKDLGIEEWRLRDAVEDSKPEYLVERLLREEQLIDKYINDNNIDYETAYKDAETRVDMHQKGKKLRKFIIDKDFDFRKLYQNKKLQQEYFDLIKDYYENTNFPPAVKENLYNEKINQLKEYIDLQKGAGDVEPIRQLIKYQNDFDLIKSGDNKVVDTWQTEKNKKEASIKNGIEDYLQEEIKNVYGEKGIRNDREIFTPSGNRRSFWQLHDEYNLENIVDNLTKGDTTGTQSWIAGFGQIQANMSNRFNSIDDIKANENKLTSLAENNEALEEARNNIENDIDEIVSRNDTDITIVSELLADFARGDLTVENFKDLTSNYYQTTQNVPDSLINKIIDDMNNLKNLPTDYFEAKPQRAVGLDEIQQVIIPNNLDTEFKQQLNDAGIKYTEYDPNIDGDRQRVINQFDELKFKLSDKRAIAPIKKNPNEVFGKEMRVQQDKAVKKAIAPLNKEIKALKKEVADLKQSNSNEYAGRFADGTEQQLQQAKKNLEFNINRLSETVDSQEYGNKIAPTTFDERLDFNKNQLKAVKEQYKELQNEYSKRGLKADFIDINKDTSKPVAPIEKAKQNPKEYRPYLEMSKEINKDETNSEVTELLNKVDSENTNVENVKPKPRKQGVIADAKRTAQYWFTNRNAEIDEYARETGNKNIKILADHVNNIQGEITTNINNAQIDNNGNVIGKSITKIFDQARQENKSDAFNDYLFHKSNMARHKQGKGSLVDFNESEQLVKAYEKDNPEFKKWAKEVNDYNTNLLYKQAEAGLITENLADNLTKMYDFYVPFFEDVEKSYNPDNINLETKSTVKSARGGADRNLLGFEEAMMRQTQSAITQIRKNQLYNEIIKTKANRSMDFENNTDPNVEGTLQESGGKYYLTGYENGKATQVEIDKDLYHGLAQRGDKLIKQAEKKIRIVTKPLQWLSDKRRNILTSWSPTFIITNPAKDLQDAPLNSKYAKDWAKNVPRAFKEITTGKGKHIDTFLNMYGQANLRGDYNLDSGLADVTKLAKTNKKVASNTNKGVLQVSKNMLKKIPQLNEIIELAPRYAEYLASIENGCSQMEALYNAREVTTNFGRGGIITKALNRNGFTFLNANVQGMSKLVRNFSGENGSKAVLGCIAKASAFGLAPALINAMLLGDDDDYEDIPDYIKDNYYLIKTSDNGFIRIPKGRMMSIFGSAGRRALERSQGKRDELSLKQDISSYFTNAYNQVGIQNPLESNIFAPLIQAKNNKTWFGSELVPKRLQTDKEGRDIPASEQYDAGTDKMSIWLGKHTGISPYKINYVVDQYSGGIGDMILPTITEEAQSKSNSVVGKAIAPLKDKFSADSITDNKNVTNFYSKVEELGKKPAKDMTKKDELSYQYLRNLSFEMGSLYKEMREVQSDKKMSDSKKYAKVQNIKAEINKIAEEGMRGYKDVESYENYARVGDRELYKYKNKKGETGWSLSDSKYADDINTLGLTVKEKNTYYTTKMKMSEVASQYGENDGSKRYRAVIKTIRKSALPSDAKYELFNSWYGKNDNSSKVAQDVGISANDYLKYKTADLSADKDSRGFSIRGSKYNKVVNFLNKKTNLNIGQKAILYRMSFGYKGTYNSNYYSNKYNTAIVKYVNKLDTTYEEDVNIYKTLGFRVDKKGNIWW